MNLILWKQVQIKELLGKNLNLIRVSKFKTSNFALCEFWHFKNINQMKFCCPPWFIFIMLCPFFFIHLDSIFGGNSVAFLFLFFPESTSSFVLLHILIFILSFTLFRCGTFTLYFWFFFSNMFKWGWIIANTLMLLKWETVEIID